MKTLKASVAGALALAAFFVSPSSIFAATVSCPSPAIFLNMSRGNSNDANTGGQVSSLQAFLWQYKSIYPDWSFPALRENFVVGIYGRRTETVVKDFQKTFMPSIVGTSGYGMVGPLTRGEIENQCKSSLSISVLKPNGGESWPVNQAQQAIRWCGNGNFPAGGSSIFLKSTDGAIYRMLAQPPSIVSCTSAQGGNYFWWSPSSGEGLEGRSHNISVVYKSTNSGAVLAEDSSDAPFNITGTAATSTVGGYTVTLDSSSPIHQWVVAGSAGVTTTQLRFTSTSTESVAITGLRLQARSGKGDSAGRHITSISLWDGSQLVSSKISPAFTNGYEDFQFSLSGASSFVIPANSSKRMTVKIDIASICVGCSGIAGSPVYVDFDGDGTSLGKNKAVGLSSALSIKASSVQDTISSGITYFRSVPTFSYLPLPTATLINGDQSLYKFRVTANPAYHVALHKVTFRVATSGVASMASQYPSFRLYNVTDNKMTVATAASAIYFKSPKNYDSSGNLIVRAYASGDYVDEIRIPAGQSRDFELRGTVLDDAVIGGSVSTTLLGDDTGLGLGMSPAKIPLDIGYDSKVIWSDYSGELAGSHSLLSSDWTNGFHVPGLPSTGLMTAILSSDSVVPPPAPANITATPINIKPIGINLLWQDNSSNETNFVLERSASANFINFIVATTTKANITSYTDRAVATSTMYYYRVKARNAGGDSGYSNIVSAVINPVDLGPPVINIVKPTPGATYQATSTAIYLAAIVSDDVGVARVEWKNMTTGVVGGLMLVGSYWTNLVTGLVQGNNQIIVTAYDAAGNSSSDQLLVIYNADSAAYSFNSTVLVDATGHGVPATNYGATLISAGKFNEAFSFNGVGDYVKVDLLNNPTAYTLEAWVKPADTTNRNIIVRTNSSGPSSVWSHEIAVSNGKFIHYTFDTAAKVVRGTTSIVPNTWYYVAVVAQNNGQARLYVNGVEEGTPVSVGTLWAGGDRYLVGSNASFASIYTAALANFKGTIDEVRIYHRALTRDEIINDMNSSTQIAQVQPSKSIATQPATRSSLASILQAISALTEQLQLYIRGF